MYLGTFLLPCTTYVWKVERSFFNLPILSVDLLYWCIKFYFQDCALNRLWKVYTYALSGENMGPILFPCWYDGATCLDQESRGVDPPTHPGGYIGGHNPPYIPQKSQSQRAAEIFPLMEILIFQLISTPNDLNFNICQIHRGDISIFPKTGRQS